MGAVVETTDKQFFLTFIGVTAALVLIAVVILVIANLIGSSADDGRVSQAQIEIANERIRPVGQVSLKSQPVSSVKEDPTSIVAISDDNNVASPADEGLGKRIYSGICQSCHAAGIAGAPIVGDIPEWRRRLDVAGEEGLYKSALQGMGAMPIKGGDPSLTDTEVKAAVDYMVSSSQ
jgi:cytochrome c5